jgi:IS605 OrfB family transposase
MVEVTRTVIVKSAPLSRSAFKAFAELEGMYRDMIEQLVLHATRSGITGFTRLKALKYGELRAQYPQLPSHYAYTACQDASTRAKSFLRLKKRRLAEKNYPEVRRVSIWLDDHLWRVESLTSIEIATHKGWLGIELEPHEQYWKYVNCGWKLATEVKVRLDKRHRQLLMYLTFKRREVEECEPRGYITIDVNENHEAILIDGTVYLFETGFKDIVLGYSYRRKRVQEKYDELYGVKGRAKKKVIRKLKERKVKDDVKWKFANIVVREAKKRRCAIVLEKLPRQCQREMIEDVKDEQLRHRLYQACFKAVQKAIKEKAREYGVPVEDDVDPKNTSRLCPIHGAKVVYKRERGDRIGLCSKGGERWHRDVVACWNLFIKALQRARSCNGSSAPSLSGLSLDGSLVPLGSTAAHDPIEVPRSLWVRWKSLDATNKHELMRMSI